MVNFYYFVIRGCHFKMAARIMPTFLCRILFIWDKLASLNYGVPASRKLIITFSIIFYCFYYKCTNFICSLFIWICASFNYTQVLKNVAHTTKRRNQSTGQKKFLSARTLPKDVSINFWNKYTIRFWIIANKELSNTCLS